MKKTTRATHAQKKLPASTVGEGISGFRPHGAGSSLWEWTLTVIKTQIIGLERKGRVKQAHSS